MKHFPWIVTLNVPLIRCPAVFYVILFYCISISSATPFQPKSGNPRYRTAYACEGNQLGISCEEGTLIHLIRANYGRYSISICNDHGNLDWKVDCTSHKSYHVISNRCNSRANCSVSGSSEHFGDPCPGTLKYIEVQYQCMSVNERRRRPDIDHCRVSASSSIFEDPCQGTAKYLEVHFQCLKGSESTNTSRIGLEKAPNSKSNKYSHFLANRTLVSPTSDPVTILMKTSLSSRPPIIVPLTQLNKASATPSTTSAYTSPSATLLSAPAFPSFAASPSPSLSPASASSATATVSAAAPAAATTTTGGNVTWVAIRETTTSNHNNPRKSGPPTKSISLSSDRAGEGRLSPEKEGGNGREAYSSAPSPPTATWTSTSLPAPYLLSPKGVPMGSLSSDTFHKAGAGVGATFPPNGLSNNSFMISLRPTPTNKSPSQGNISGRPPLPPLPTPPPYPHHPHHNENKLDANEWKHRETSRGRDDSSQAMESIGVAPYLNDYHTTVTTNNNNNRNNPKDGQTYCPQIVARGITWPATQAGHLEIQPCPPPSVGLARWECGRQLPLRREGLHPDLSLCSSYWVQSLRSRVENGDSIVSVASQLAQRTGSTQLFGGDLVHSMNLLQSLVNKMGSSVGDISEERQRHQIVKEFVQSVVEVTSNLVDQRNKGAWLDLTSPLGMGNPSPKLPQTGGNASGQLGDTHHRNLAKRVASNLIEVIENGALLLAATQSTSYHFTKAHSNVLVSVQLVDSNVTGVREMKFPTEEMTLGTVWMGMSDTLVLPLQTSVSGNHLAQVGGKGVLKVVFLVFRNVGHFLGTSLSEDQVRGGEGQGRTIINSKVMSLSLVGDTQNSFNVNLAKPVTVTFKHIEETNVSHPKCVFWDSNVSDWSSEGCWMVATNKSHTGCSCNHLTTLALLMDINGDHISRVEDETEKILIVAISCLVSLVFSCLTLGLLIFSRIRCDRLTIYKNLCLNLILVQVTLLLIAYRTPLEKATLCFLLFSFLHFLLLSIFLWVFMDALRVYCFFTRNCDINSLLPFKCLSNSSLVIYVLSYGFPLLTVFLVALFYPDLYRKPFGRHFSWINFDLLSDGGGGGAGGGGGCEGALLLFLPSILASVGSLLLLGVIPFTKNTAPDKEMTADTKKSSLVPPLLVLTSQAGTWVVGNMFFSHYTSASTALPMGCVFAFLNILQSIVLFVLCFAKNDKVRGNIQKSLSAVHWLPECVRTEKAGPSISIGPPETQTTYFYSLDPSQLAPPPSPMIRQSVHHHHNHLLQEPLSASPPTMTPTLSNNRYIPEVNPYAPPVPVPIHDYEDIATAMRDVNYTLPYNNAHNHRHHHHQQQHRHHPVVETFGYDSQVRPDSRGAQIYGRSQGPNFCYNSFSTRSPIYYSENRR